MAVDVIAILTSPVVLALAAYAALVGVLALALQPMRLKMVDIAEDMLSEGHWNRDQREEINIILDTMACVIATCALPIAVIAATACTILGISPPREPWMARLEQDERFDELTWRYFVSVLGANPVAAVVTIVLMLIYVPVALVFRRTSLRQAVEGPILTAAASMAASGYGRRFAT